MKLLLCISIGGEKKIRRSASKVPYSKLYTGTGSTKEIDPSQSEMEKKEEKQSCFSNRLRGLAVLNSENFGQVNFS